MRLSIGKLPPDILRRLLVKLPGHESVLVGPTYGEDAAAVQMGEEVLLVASDPVTFATDRIGYYAVCVNANDIAVHGARPRYFLATILMPEHSEDLDVERVFDQISESCARINVTLIGGHTEVTQGVNQVVVCGCMLGEVGRDKLLKTAGARPGDDLILTGGVAIEGTAILAREACSRLEAQGVPHDVLVAGARLLDAPGICIVDYAMAAVNVGGVTSMHDPTEGGLAMALRELAVAADVGLVVYREAIRVLPECEIICRVTGLDPLGLIASGSLLITCVPEKSSEVVNELCRMSVPAGIIGKVVEKAQGVRFADGAELPVFERDEIARYFEDMAVA
ncbi:MAG: AIR synthase family protein [Armatimonadota bacterium]